MLIDNDPKLDFCDVQIKPKRSELGSRKDVDLEREFTFRWSNQKYKGIPIIAANMDTVSTFKMASTLSEFNLGTALYKHYTVQSLIEFFSSAKGTVFYSMGILEHDQEKLEAVLKEVPINYICIDVANGYSERFVDFVKSTREKYPDITLMCGNVVTAEMTEQLILSGADIVKVGIGSGSACTTRKMTGVGYPQLSAIIESMDAAHGLGGLICADGGCQVPGDVGKAFAAGADFVMLGGMLAGHDECEGELIYDGEEIIGVRFYGMSSEAAMTKYSGGVADYRAPEGKDVLVPYRGPVKNTIQKILGGVRSTCTYTGARRLKDLSKCTTFIIVNHQWNTIYGDD